jgi:hypothetical protein
VKPRVRAASSCRAIHEGKDGRQTLGGDQGNNAEQIQNARTLTHLMFVRTIRKMSELLSLLLIAPSERMGS